MHETPVVSVIMPSLDEEGTIATCIEKAKSVFEKNGICGEVVIADSSTDKTPTIAKKLGANVIIPPKKGYGNAYLEGLSQAKGNFIIIADADGTYDLLDIPKFLEPLMNGTADFVIGSRLKGEIKKGAMPWLHQHIGNPLLTGILNFLFNVDISDAHCGMRAFTKNALEKMDLRSGGMEFASEMVIEAVKKDLKIVEVPITYYPRDGASSKLNSFTDGWRHLRFMMLYNPAIFFLIPGIVLFLLGLFLTFMLFSLGGGVETRLHSFILGGILSIMGFQTMVMGINTKVYGIVYGTAKAEGLIKRFLDYRCLEVELFIGAFLFLIGLVMGIRILIAWIYSGYGSLSEVGNAVLAMVTSSIGISLVFSALFVSMILLGSKE